MYQGIAFRTAYLLTGSAADAEDAAQTRLRQGVARAAPVSRRLAVSALAAAHRGERGAQPPALGREGLRLAAPRGRDRALGRRGPVSRGSRARARAAGGAGRSGPAARRARSRRPDLSLPARALRGGDRHRPRCPPRHREVPHRASACPPPDGGRAVSELERALGSSRAGARRSGDPGPGAGRARRARAARAAAAWSAAAGSSLSRSSSSPRWRRRWRFPTRARRSSACSRSAASASSSSTSCRRYRSRTTSSSTLGERRHARGGATERAPSRSASSTSAPDRVYVGDRGTVWFLYGIPRASLGCSSRSRPCSRRSTRSS